MTKAMPNPRYVETIQPPLLGSDEERTPPSTLRYQNAGNPNIHNLVKMNTNDPRRPAFNPNPVTTETVGAMPTSVKPINARRLLNEKIWSAVSISSPQSSSISIFNAARAPEGLGRSGNGSGFPSGPINGGRSESDGSGSAFGESTASNPASSCERYLRTL